MRFYYKVRELHNRLDLLIREIEVSLPDSTEEHLGSMIITDLETGKKFKIKE